MFASRYFNLGQLVCTQRVNDTIAENLEFTKDVVSAIKRYCGKDWGDLSDADKQLNEDALNYPGDLYLLAAYQTCKGKIWIITNRKSEEAGDNVTTVLFHDER